MRIAVAGEALIDFTLSGPLAFQGHVGGSLLNTAIACARLGQPTGLLTQLSTDLFGDALFDYLKTNRVDTRYILRSDAPSTLAFVERTPTTNRYAFYMEGSADSQWAPQPLPDLPAGCAALHFGSISLLREPAARHILALAQASIGQRLVVLDPNVRANLIADVDRYRSDFAGWLKAADLVKLSDEDAAFLAGGAVEPTIDSWLAQGAKAVVMTRGGEGATLYRAGQSPLAVPARRVQVVDTIGAGDTFSAGLSVGLIERGVTRGSDLAALDDAAWREVLAFAAAAAALNTTKPGADPPQRAVLEAFLQRG